MAGVALRRPRKPLVAITLVPMVDIMVIMLIFFMVTSTYLDLDMVPAVEQSDDPPAEGAAGPAPGGVLMVRIGADGAPVIRGERLELDALAETITARLQAEPLTQIVLLPSAEATMQALVTVMDRATFAGATRLKVIRLEARQ